MKTELLNKTKITDLPLTDNVDISDKFILEKDSGTHIITAKQLGLTKVEVIDNLDSDNPTCALSAKQGKVLNQKIEDKVVIDNLSSASKEAGLSANMGRVLNDKIDEHALTVIDDLVTISPDQPLSANQGVILKKAVDKLSAVEVIDTLGSTSATDALSANMGRVLDKKIDDNMVDVEDTLTSSKTDTALSANQGKVLKKILDDTRVSVTDTLVSPSTTDALSANQGRVLRNMISDKQTVVVDNTSSASTTAALSANQGRVLKEKIEAVPVITVVNALTSDRYTDTALSAKQGKVLNDKITGLQQSAVEVVNSFEGGATKALSSLKGKELLSLINAIPKITVVNNLRAITLPKPPGTSETEALSANMGRVLNEKIDNSKVDVINHLNFLGETGKALDAKQGPIIKERLDNSGNTIKITGSKLALISTRGNDDVVLSEVTIPSVSIVDNLASADSMSALSANQGRVLNDTKAESIRIVGKSVQLEGPRGPIGKVISLPIADVVDSVSSTDRYNALSANQGRVLNEKIQTTVAKMPTVEDRFIDSPTAALSASKGLELHVSKADSLNISDSGHVQLTSNGVTIGDAIELPKPKFEDNLTSVAVDAGLSANQGRLLHINKMSGMTLVGKTLKKVTGSGTEAGGIVLPIPDVSNNLTTTTTGKTLDAVQGKVLNDRITSIVNNALQLCDNLTNTSAGKALDSRQGKILDEKKAQNLIYNQLEQSIQLSNGNKAIGSKIRLILPEVTTALNVTEAGFVLDARAGATLKSRIDAIELSGGTEIINTVTSTRTDAALSANMGKHLNAVKADSIRMTGNSIELMSGSTVLGTAINIPVVTLSTTWENNASKAFPSSLGYQLRTTKYDDVKINGRTLVFSANGVEVNTIAIPGVTLTNEVTGTDANLALSQAGGNKLHKKDIKAFATNGNSMEITLNDDTKIGAIVPQVALTNELGVTAEGTALDATAGKILVDMINGSKVSVTDGFTSASTTSAASANSVKTLHENKVEGCAIDPANPYRMVVSYGAGSEAAEVLLPNPVYRDPNFLPYTTVMGGLTRHVLKVSHDAANLTEGENPTITQEYPLPMKFANRNNVAIIVTIRAITPGGGDMIQVFGHTCTIEAHADGSQYVALKIKYVSPDKMAFGLANLVIELIGESNYGITTKEFEAIEARYNDATFINGNVIETISTGGNE